MSRPDVREDGDDDRPLGCYLFEVLVLAGLAFAIGVVIDHLFRWLWAVT